MTVDQAREVMRAEIDRQVRRWIDGVAPCPTMGSVLAAAVVRLAVLRAIAAAAHYDADGPFAWGAPVDSTTLYGINLPGQLTQADGGRSRNTLSE